MFYRGAHNLFILLHRKDVFYGKNNQLAEDCTYRRTKK